MSTKIKGDKIKEGSIPLSALSSGNTLLEGLVGDPVAITRLEEDNKNYYPGGSVNMQTIYVKIAQLDSLFELTKYNTLILKAGPISEIIWDDNGVRITRYASYYNPIIYSKVKAPTPDWNAQEGEAGYINNKLCHINFNDYRKVNYSDYDEVEELGDGSRKYKYYGKAGYIIFPVLNYDNAEQSYEVIHTSIEFQDIPLEIPTWAGESDCKFADDGDGHLIVLELFEGAANSLQWFIPIYEEYENAIYSLPDWSIPDTVLKTTPQTLSDADKNQALANLGIDPVVWKYICNPLVIENGNTVPEELIGTFDDDNGVYNIKYPCKGMYTIYVRSDSTDSPEKFYSSSEIVPVERINNGWELESRSTFFFKDEEYNIVCGTCLVYATIGQNKKWNVIAS